MEIKLKTKFDIDDIAYVFKSNMAQGKKIVEIQYLARKNILYYIDANTNYYTEDMLFKTKEECEKNYVLNKFGHLFKDTKTLK